MIVDVDILPHCRKIVESDKKFNLMHGGVGSAKTFTAGDLLVKFRCESQYNRVIIGANTYRQLRDSTMKAVMDRLSMYGLNEDEHWEYQEAKGFFNLMGMTCILRTLDNVDKAIAGLTVHKGIFDEFAFAGRPSQPLSYVYKKLIQRFRAPEFINGDKITRQFYALTSPNGINYLHDVWKTNATDDHYYVQCRTKDNIFLPDGYYESMVAAYGGEDTPLARQELFGEFVNVLEATVYHSFDRSKHVADCKHVKRKAGSELCGQDFNVDKMGGVIGKIVDDHLYIYDENFGCRDTIALMDDLTRRGYRQLSVIPDSTGKNRKTTGPTDFQIIKQSGHRILTTHNPLVFDRVNNLNRLFIENRITIDPSCKRLINDLERVVWRGGKLDQTTDPDLTHVSDGLGYLAWKLMNLRGNIDLRPRIGRR